jgi:hypothetical protein
LCYLFFLIQKGSLEVTQFAAASHIIRARKLGFNIPSILPNQLILSIKSVCEYSRGSPYSLHKSCKNLR